MMFRLAHLSDLHLGPLPKVAYRELASKRVVGYVNWHRNRRRSMHDTVIDAIVADLKACQPDHVAVTGDLVNLALDGEIALARSWLEAFGAPADVSVVPGNHDAYVPGAFDKICTTWGPWMTGDAATHAVDRRSFPYLRVRGDVALIGVSTARATAPFMATGFFREDQSIRLRRLLHRTRQRGLFRVVMIHHPPVRFLVPQHKRLMGITRFQNVIRDHGAELVLHGHSHDPTLSWIDGRSGRVPVVGVAAAGQAPGGAHAPAQFNLIEIAGKAGAWNVRLSRRGIAGPTIPPAELGSVELYAGAPEAVAG